jgi:hypothetical protein
MAGPPGAAVAELRGASCEGRVNLDAPCGRASCFFDPSAGRAAKAPTPKETAMEMAALSGHVPLRPARPACDAGAAASAENRGSGAPGAPGPRENIRRGAPGAGPRASSPCRGPRFAPCRGMGRFGPLGTLARPYPQLARKMAVPHHYAPHAAHPPDPRRSLRSRQVRNRTPDGRSPPSPSGAAPARPMPSGAAPARPMPSGAAPARPMLRTQMENIRRGAPGAGLRARCRQVRFRRARWGRGLFLKTEN